MCLYDTLSKKDIQWVTVMRAIQNTKYGVSLVWERQCPERLVGEIDIATSDKAFWLFPSQSFLTEKP